MADNLSHVPEVMYDEKGRPLPVCMEDRELLIELVQNMRVLADAVDDMSSSPMVKAMMNGGNPLAGMFGRG